MRFDTDYRLESFILNTAWDDLPGAVKVRARVCFTDLMCALIIGSKSAQFEAGQSVAKAVFGKGDVAIVGSAEKYSFMGAACAMGHSSNAYDIDDGHNIIRAHPGTSFIGGILAAACEKQISYKELLTTLIVSYETTVRMGRAIMDYYQFPHSSGTFGAVGTAAGVGRIYKFNEKQMNNVLSVSEFNAPLVPGIRSVEYPSMNKDGVPFGVMIGAMAVMETLNSFTGNKNLLEADEFKHYTDDLGESFEVMRLYFKPYTCCRWGQPAIDACLHIMRENKITQENIERVELYTFKSATMLSKAVPKTADEAQYNIAYPVAAAIVTGDFGFEQITAESFANSDIISMMKKLSFATEPEFEAEFPQRRICRAEITTKDGRRYVSPQCEPRGEADENIGPDWINDKFKRITAPVLSISCQDRILDMIYGSLDLTVPELIDQVNECLFYAS